MKSPIQLIRLWRIHGNPRPVPTIEKATTLAEANAVLALWAQAVPVDEIHKVKVEIYWRVGLFHVFRVSMRHPSAAPALDIAAEFQRHINLALGRTDDPAPVRERLLEAYVGEDVVADLAKIEALCALVD
jgi:hypothetical protein